jgi:DivIVA domain-containing protein
MPLTPEDVSNKRFTPVRLREGYDMGEVDQFLDEVEAELVRLTSENEDLRRQLTAAGHGDGLPSTPVTDSTGSAPTSPDGTSAEAATPDATSATPADVTSDTAPPTGGTEPVVTATSTTPPETLKITTASEASSAAVRLLEIATRNADELVDEARAEAERREAESRATAERVEAAAQSRAQALDAETEERRQQLLGALETEKQALNGEIENLRSFEREYRSRLKSYFEQQLDALNNGGDGTRPAQPENAAEPPSSGPGRLQSLLGGNSSSSSSSSSKDTDRG